MPIATQQKKRGIATVVKNTGNLFLLSQIPEWKPFPAVLQGKIRIKENNSTNPIAVGDIVEYELPYTTNSSFQSNKVEANKEKCINIDITESGVTNENPATIVRVLDRKNHLIRKATNLSKNSHIIAANIDRAYIVVSLYFPQLKSSLLDRILLTCEVYNVPVTIVVNKIDLYRDEALEELQHFRSLYENIGYNIIETSTKTLEGIDKLKNSCKGKINLFFGESGVGKSSLIKSIDPSIDIKIAAISNAHLQGKHTTSFYQMYKLLDDIYVIDTPGIRAFGLDKDLKKEELALYFPEMFRFSHQCRFSPCSHTHEPDCAVKKAIEEGLISEERYNSYLGMLEEDSKYR